MPLHSVDGKESMIQIFRRASSLHPVDRKSTAVSLLGTMEFSNVSLKFNSVSNICETVQLLNFKTFNQRSYNSLTED